MTSLSNLGFRGEVFGGNSINGLGIVRNDLDLKVDPVFGRGVRFIVDGTPCFFDDEGNLEMGEINFDPKRGDNTDYFSVTPSGMRQALGEFSDTETLQMTKNGFIIKAGENGSVIEWSREGSLVIRSHDGRVTCFRTLKETEKIDWITQAMNRVARDSSQVVDPKNSSFMDLYRGQRAKGDDVVSSIPEAAIAWLGERPAAQITAVVAMLAMLVLAADHGSDKIRAYEKAQESAGTTNEEATNSEESLLDVIGDTIQRYTDLNRWIPGN